jgi:hypothetical protein
MYLHNSKKGFTFVAKKQSNNYDDKGIEKIKKRRHCIFTDN